jgi:diguanylate cyclase (GGDEF)-like protein
MSPIERPSPTEDALERRVRLAAALAQAPLAVLYRIEGDRARRVSAHGAHELVRALPIEVPSWRVARERVAVVPMVGRGPSARESAVLPASFGAAAIVSAPVHVGGVVIGTLILADSQPRPDLARLDLAALETACSLVGELLERERRTEESGIRRSEPYLPAVESLPPDTAELAAWPVDVPGHDPVTGLPDRRVLTRAIDLAIAEATAGGLGLAVAIVALDRFQRIDDWLGRSVGDELLRQVAERILDTTSDRDLVGRGSGDEIIVALVGRRDESAAGLADRLLQAIREPFHVQGYDLAVTATIGLSRFPADASDASTLLRYAGIALHRAKGRRRGRLEQFTPELKEAVEQRGEVERHLRRAIGARELLLHYQPKVDVHTRRTTGVEALIRWKRGSTMVSPGHFLPVAEESELIVPIGTWVLVEASRQMREWLRRGIALGSVSVNVSALQFARPDFVGTVGRALESAGLDPRHLELEITETSIMDDVGSAAERLAALRRLGVRVSVDDFGTGYSSLAYLQRLPFDVLKIDRSFVQELDAAGPAREQARALAQTITGLGHGLGLKVLAEGVETEAQLRAVADVGCDEVQGFYFSRPLPPDQLVEHLARHP